MTLHFKAFYPHFFSISITLVKIYNSRIIINRDKNNFELVGTVLNLTLKLSPNMNHEIAMDRISMTYSWHNITKAYNNNTIKCSSNNGGTWKTVTFVDVMYSYNDINDYLHKYMDKQTFKTGNNYHINIIFVLSSYKVVVEIDNNDY